MKKILALVLALVTLLSLCSCASDSLAVDEAKTAETQQKTEAASANTQTKKKFKAPDDLPEGFTAGFGRADITPTTFPIDLGGDAVATSVADPLYASCTAISDGESVAVLFHLDMKSIPVAFIGTVSERLNKKFGIPVDNVLLNATHSHNSPLDVTGSDDFSLRWRKNVLDAMDQAVLTALCDLAPAEIYTGTADAEGYAFVRRYLMGDGSWNGIQMNNPNQDYVAHETEADPQLRTIRFERGDKKDILLANWQAHAAHGRGLHPNLVSSDFIYELRTGVEKNMDVHFSYHNGSSGNLNFTDYLGNQKYSNFHEVGTALVDVVAESVKNEEKVNPGKLLAATTTVTCTVFVDSPELVEGAAKYAEASVDMKPNILAEYGLISSYHASAINSRQHRLKNGPTVDVKLYAISCGDIAFFTSPFEQFDADGKYVRDASPFKMTFSCAYSNGHYGYLPSSEAYPHGCYEVYTSPFVEGTSDLLNAGSLSILNQLYSSAL